MHQEPEQAHKVQFVKEKKKECDLLEAFTSDIATAVFIFTQNVWGQLSFEVRSQSVWAGQSNYRAARSARASGVRGERLFEPQIITCFSLTSLQRLALDTGSVFVSSLGIVLKSMFRVRTWTDVCRLSEKSLPLEGRRLAGWAWLSLDQSFFRTSALQTNASTNHDNFPA